MRETWLLIGSLWIVLGLVGLLRRRPGLQAQRPLNRFLKPFRLARSEAYYEHLGMVIPLGFIAIGFLVIAISLATW
jgi:hypothetical protein